MDNEPRMNLDDEEMSLHSKLQGGGRDLGSEAGAEEVRLCPGCGRVTTFVQGKCSNCEYKPGMSAGIDEAAALRYQYAGTGGGSSATRAMLIVLVLLLLCVVGYFVYTGVTKKAADGDGTPSTYPAAEPSSAPPAATATPPESHPGALAVVALDEAFHAKLEKALTAANTALSAAQAGSYVYRYRITDNIVPATSQTIGISLYLGGEQAAAHVEAPGNAALTAALQPILDDIATHAGVTATISYYATGGKEAPDANDVYLRYGYDFGLEHMAKLQPVIDALEETRTAIGEYPDQISANIVSPQIKTHGSLSFASDGFGYLPVFETDAKGNIVMGSGKGIASFKPRSVTGYYLVLYTGAESDGLDLYTTADYRYYQDNILPFPYDPKGPVTNMALKPDGTPDGIACVVKNGKLQP